MREKNFQFAYFQLCFTLFLDEATGKKSNGPIKLSGFLVIALAREKKKGKGNVFLILALVRIDPYLRSFSILQRTSAAKTDRSYKNLSCISFSN